MARTIRQHPERVNCPPIHPIVPANKFDLRSKLEKFAILVFLGPERSPRLETVNGHGLLDLFVAGQGVCLVVDND